MAVLIVSVSVTPGMPESSTPIATRLLGFVCGAKLGMMERVIGPAQALSLLPVWTKSPRTLRSAPLTSRPLPERNNASEGTTVGARVLALRAICSWAPSRTTVPENGPDVPKALASSTRIAP